MQPRSQSVRVKGHLVLFGPEITWRAQPHGTFKLLFNGVYFGTAAPTNVSMRSSEQ